MLAQRLPHLLLRVDRRLVAGTATVVDADAEAEAEAEAEDPAAADADSAVAPVSSARRASRSTTRTLSC